MQKRNCLNSVHKALLVSLLFSDFLLLNVSATPCKYKHSNFSFFTKNKILTYFFRLVWLDIFKNLMLFSRLIFFLKRLKKKASIGLLLPNLFSLDFLQYFFAKKNICSQLFCTTSFFHNMFNDKKVITKALFSFNAFFPNSKDLNVLLLRQMFLLHCVFSFYKKNFVCTYSFYNILDDFKKLLFLGVFLVKILK